MHVTASGSAWSRGSCRLNNARISFYRTDEQQKRAPALRLTPSIYARCPNESADALQAKTEPLPPC